jgi:hypothetical protein
LVLSNGSSFVIRNNQLPFVFSSQLPQLVFSPHTDTASLVNMCAAADSFQAVVFNPNESWNVSSLVTTITLQLNCERHVCPAGSQLVAVSTGSVRFRLGLAVTRLGCADWKLNIGVYGVRNRLLQFGRQLHLQTVSFGSHVFRRRAFDRQKKLLAVGTVLLQV